MSRWPVLLALSLSAWTVGCATSVRPGLANAPRLGGTGVADERVRDVVANGDDACGVHAEHGSLRYRVPPCPAVHPAMGSSWLPVSARSSSDALVVPWLQHFYVGWPCARPGYAARTEATTVAWDPPVSTVAACSR